MTCQSCGAEIADKAIVCYRCGAPTALPPSTRPERKPPAAPGRPLGAAALILIGLVLFVSVMLAGAAESWDLSVRVAGEAVGVVLAVVGGWRLLRRGR